MLRQAFPILCLTALALGGCGQDALVGRFARATCETVPLLVVDGNRPPPAAVPSLSMAAPCFSSIPTASASAFSIATPPPAPTGAAVSAIGSAPGPDEAMFHRTLVVTVRKEGLFNPTDRLEATDVTIIPSGARFKSWDAIATAYTAINAGTVQLAQTRGFSESLTAGAPASAPISASATAGATQSDARTENFTAQAQSETLTASLSPDGDMLRIHRQGGYGVDLTGNTVIKVDLAYGAAAPPVDGAANNSMLYDRFTVLSYSDAKKRPLPIRKLELASITEMGLPPGHDIKADVYLTYTLRHVVSGDTTYEEKDDVVREITTGPVYQLATLVSSREASETGYGVMVGKSALARRRLSVSLQGGPAEPLCFGTRDEANSFIRYLRARALEDPSSLSNARVGVRRPELNPDNPPLTLRQVDLEGALAVSGCL